MKAITITFGDQAENHVGMQKLGTLAKEGFTLKDLENVKEKFENGELIKLSNDNQPEAYILIIRNGINQILKEMQANDDDLFEEQLNLNWDKKAKMYGKVVNKHARHNLCFGDFDQEPNYEEGKGRIINFDNLPCTKYIKDELENYFGIKAYNLVAEGNFYFNEHCFIGFHGDAERKKVIALRLGDSMPLYYQWYFKNEAIGNKIEISLNHGDIYVMSEYATGYNWKRKTIMTLRHAANFK